MWYEAKPDDLLISREDGDIFRSLPSPAREEVEKNIHEYIQQAGRDYGVVPDPNKTEGLAHV